MHIRLNRSGDIRDIRVFQGNDLRHHIIARQLNLTFTTKRYSFLFRRCDLHDLQEFFAHRNHGDVIDCKNAFQRRLRFTNRQLCIAPEGYRTSNIRCLNQRPVG